MSIASMFGKPLAFYGPNGPGDTITCPDCGRPADALFKDHGGDCLDHTHIVLPRTALGIIRRHALHNVRFSINHIRPLFNDAGIDKNSRGPAFDTAQRKRFIEKDGYEPSTDGPTKGSPVAVYHSLIFIPDSLHRKVGA